MASAKGLGRRILTCLAIGLACALVAWVPSAYVAARGGPAWFSAVIAGLAFPVLPVVWHFLGERRRAHRRAAAPARTAKPAAAALGGRDRFALRTAAVAFVAIAPLVAFDRSHLWAGLRHHALWFVPGPARLAAGYAAPLVAQVPRDAELVVVARDHPMRLVDPSFAAHGAFAMASRADGRAVTIVPDNPAANEGGARALAWLASIAGTPTAPPIATRRAGAVLLAPPGWGTAGGGPSAEVTAQLLRAPATALVVIGGAFATPATGESGIRTVAGWITRTGDHIDGEVRMVLVDPAAADRLVTTATAAITAATSAPPERARAWPMCIGTLVDVARGAHVERQGAEVRVHASLAGATARAYVACLRDLAR